MKTMKTTNTRKNKSTEIKKTGMAAIKAAMAKATDKVAKKNKMTKRDAKEAVEEMMVIFAKEAANILTMPEVRKCLM